MNKYPSVDDFEQSSRLLAEWLSFYARQGAAFARFRDHFISVFGITFSNTNEEVSDED